MPRETKGQKVKSFQVSIPLPNLEREKKIVSVYFRAKESTFHAELPRHIVEGVGNHPERTGKMRGGEIVTPLADEVQPAYEQMLKLFERIQQNAAKKKVIQIHVNANGRYTQQFKSISFVHGGGPALSFAYHVLWQVGDGLYSSADHGRSKEEPFLTYITRAPKPDDKPIPGAGKETFVIDWTEEREAFVESICNGLETLIKRLGELLIGDTAQNVDRLIAGGAGLMLPAPQQEDA